MFENLNWWEIAALLVVALLIFGDKLPKVIADGLKMVRNLRNMATSATADLSRELGTDIKLEDLHPKAFIRKHLLSEEEEQALRKPLQGLYDDVKSDLNGVKSDLGVVKEELDGVRTAGRRGHTADRAAPAAGSPQSAAHGFDGDAT